MDGVLLGVLAMAPSALPWVGRPYAIALVVAIAALLVLSGVLVYRRRRRGRRGTIQRGQDALRGLKERLRRRLGEPTEAFGHHAGAGPTIGTSEAVEADLDRAAEGVLREAGWRRSGAKHLLRQSLNGHAPNGALNGSEAAHWRQLGALALLDDTHDALLAYSRAAEFAPDDPELHMLLG